MKSWVKPKSKINVYYIAAKCQYGSRRFKMWQVYFSRVKFKVNLNTCNIFNTLYSFMWLMIFIIKKVLHWPIILINFPELSAYKNWHIFFRNMFQLHLNFKNKLNLRKRKEYICWGKERSKEGYSHKCYLVWWEMQVQEILRETQNI